MTIENDDFDDLRVRCAACGDPATNELNGKSYCHECYLELAKGIISTRPAKIQQTKQHIPPLS